MKIVDFGIAKMSDIETPGAPGRKLTKTGMIFGTPEYMSPEQAAGKADLDHRVDIYALAVIFFEMITGRVPLRRRHVHGDPHPAHVRGSAGAPRGEPAHRGPAADRRLHLSRPGQGAERALPDLRRDGGRARGGPRGRATASTLPGYGGGPAPARRRPARGVSATAATGEMPAGNRSRAGLVVGALVVVAAAALGGGAVWYFGSATEASDPDDDGPRGTIASPALDAGRELDPPAEPDAGSVAAQPATQLDAGPAMVTITVATEPAGARVYLVGRGEICAQTPAASTRPPARRSPCARRAGARPPSRSSRRPPTRTSSSRCGPSDAARRPSRTEAGKAAVRAAAEPGAAAARAT
ncbi:MAG: hypothetical protein M5U28_34935 [Sandaracinaceae bacterium]|nr:hypothetical protein [Sandaracinaceae bacterium]